MTKSPPRPSLVPSTSVGQLQLLAELTKEFDPIDVPQCLGVDLIALEEKGLLVKIEGGWVITAEGTARAASLTPLERSAWLVH